MEPLTPENAGQASDERRDAEESRAQSSAAEPSTARRDSGAFEAEEAGRRAGSEPTVERWAEADVRYAPPPAASYGGADAYPSFSLLASPDTTVPPSNDSYACPFGDETWERVHVGEEPPACSRHGARMIRV